MQHTQAALHVDTMQLRELINNIPGATAIYSANDMRIVHANKAMIGFWGKDESVIGKRLIDALPEIEGQPFIDLLHGVFTSGKSVAFKEAPAVLEIDGQLQTFYFDFTYSPLKNNNGEVEAVINSATDVTELVRARKELERAEEQLRTAIDSAEMGTWFIDVNTMHLTTSPRLNELFGFNPYEKITLDMAISHINEQHRDRVVAAINLAISSGEPYDIEYPTMGFKDGKTRWVRATGKLYKSEEGKPLHFSGTALDITERKENEQRKDDFISIASHELKTPVTTLKASIQLLNRMKDDMPSPVMQRLVEQSNKSMQKVSTLIDDLLNVTRMNQGQLHLNKTVFTTADLLGECCSNVREDGAYTLKIQGDMNLSVFADRHRIDQVLVNLVNNAVKYANESYTITLQAEKVDNKAKISVIDAGPGIAPDKQPYLFDRYYRADPKGNQYSGLGLGLYISAEIVKRHNGEIGVISELGKGSTFWFTLPLVD